LDPQKRLLLELLVANRQTSSINRISGCNCVATEKAKRATIPEEYVLTGISKKAPNSEKAIICE